VLSLTLRLLYSTRNRIAVLYRNRGNQSATQRKGQRSRPLARAQCISQLLHTGTLDAWQGTSEGNETVAVRCPCLACPVTCVMQAVSPVTCAM